MLPFFLFIFLLFRFGQRPAHLYIGEFPFPFPETLPVTSEAFLVTSEAKSVTLSATHSSDFEALLAPSSSLRDPHCPFQGSFSSPPGFQAAFKGLPSFLGSSSSSQRSFQLPTSSWTFITQSCPFTVIAAIIPCRAAAPSVLVLRESLTV